MSGFSTGAFMASSMHVVHSETIKGIGLVDGGPHAYLQERIKFDSAADVIVLNIAELTIQQRQEGQIDSLLNLIGSPVYITES